MRPTEIYEFQIIEWSNHRPNEELCGILVKHRGTFNALQIRNVAADRQNTFAMDGGPFLEAINSGQAWGTWHVHPGPTDEDGPSLADRDRANAWQLPGCILIRKHMHFRYYLPDDTKTPIPYRPYVPGVFDCYALVKDALAEYLGFTVPELDRELLDPVGALSDPDVFWGRNGWERLLQPAVGRVAMIDLGGQGKCNHLGLIVSKTEILHQIRGQLSRLDFFGSWQRWALGYLAHPEIEKQVKDKGWARLPVDPAEFQISPPPPRTDAMAPNSLVDASGRPTRVTFPEGAPKPPVRQFTRDIRPRRPKL